MKLCDFRPLSEFPFYSQLACLFERPIPSCFATNKVYISGKSISYEDFLLPVMNASHLLRNKDGGKEKASDCMTVHHIGSFSSDVFIRPKSESSGECDFEMIDDSIEYGGDKLGIDIKLFETNGFFKASNYATSGLEKSFFYGGVSIHSRGESSMQKDKKNKSENFYYISDIYGGKENQIKDKERKHIEDVLRINKNLIIFYPKHLTLRFDNNKTLATVNEIRIVLKKLEEMFCIPISYRYAKCPNRQTFFMCIVDSPEQIGRNNLVFCLIRIEKGHFDFKSIELIEIPDNLDSFLFSVFAFSLPMEITPCQK